MASHCLFAHRRTKIDPNCCGCLYHCEVNLNDPKPHPCKTDIWSTYKVVFLNQNEEKGEEVEWLIKIKNMRCSNNRGAEFVSIEKLKSFPSSYWIW